MHLININHFTSLPSYLIRLIKVMFTSCITSTTSVTVD